MRPERTLAAGYEGMWHEVTVGCYMGAYMQQVGSVARSAKQTITPGRSSAMQEARGELASSRSRCAIRRAKLVGGVTGGL